jgi:hypothetical protein
VPVAPLDPKGVAADLRHFVDPRRLGLGRGHDPSIGKDVGGGNYPAGSFD